MIEEPYTAKTMKLNSNAGFVEQFYAEYAGCKTMIEAYEKTEELHHRYFGKYRFASYGSFRHILRQKCS